LNAVAFTKARSERSDLSRRLSSAAKNFAAFQSGESLMNAVSWKMKGPWDAVAQSNSFTRDDYPKRGVFKHVDGVPRQNPSDL